RQAINSPVQSTASDFTLMAMVLTHESLFDLYKKRRAYIIGQVHDSILIECDEDLADRVAEKLKYIMEVCVPLEIRKRFHYDFPVPLGAEVQICASWGGTPKKGLA